MPLQFAVMLIAFAIAVVLVAAGIVVTRRSTGSTRTIGAWVAILSGLVALCLGVMIVMFLIAASMDDVPGLW